jgi:hypothetical protein
MNYENINLQTYQELDIPFDYEKILNEYGPEGCYHIAHKLMEIADQDVSNALNQEI